MVREVPSNRALLFKSSDLELSGPRWDMSHKPLPEQSDAPGWEGALGEALWALMVQSPVSQPWRHHLSNLSLSGVGPEGSCRKGTGKHSGWSPRNLSTPLPLPLHRAWQRPAERSCHHPQESPSRVLGLPWCRPALCCQLCRQSGGIQGCLHPPLPVLGGLVPGEPRWDPEPPAPALLLCPRLLLPSAF